MPLGVRSSARRDDVLGLPLDVDEEQAVVEHGLGHELDGVSPIVGEGGGHAQVDGLILRVDPDEVLILGCSLGDPVGHATIVAGTLGEVEEVEEVVALRVRRSEEKGERQFQRGPYLHATSERLTLAKVSSCQLVARLAAWVWERLCLAMPA